MILDWEIDREKSRVARINGAGSSSRTRKRKFRHAVNAMIKTIVGYACYTGVYKIVVGNLKGIRNNGHNNSRVDSMVHNF